ncbi:HET-domain-containing protein [Stipitochalara longipes BDJ]|nr:HET-domain-containing protein [Stipitochalara longipes BDJ]
MALCTLCRSIPFVSLPSVPEGQDGLSRVADNIEMPELWWRSRDNNELLLLKDSIGFAWHESFNALEESAKAGCPLCILVQSGVQIWLDYFREAERTYPGWRQFYKDSEPIPDEERLWLTKRLGGGDGFMVLARNPVKDHRVFFLTAVNFSVEAGSDLASKFSLRPMERDSGSRQSLDTAASLLSNCIEKHKRCAKEMTPLPSRVLDVGSTGDMIRLIDCPTDLRGRYISLSHCWGSSETLTTTEESYEARIAGIPLSQLPKTFLDAVIIARHLGVRYVWIDSLCIMQENQDDWARESGRMNSVYSNAYLVIAANHATDSNGGCFHNRPARPKSKVNLPDLGEVWAQLLYPGDETAPSGTSFEGEPLSGRGWALQERVLARRILHYNTRQILLECNHGIVGEDGCSFDYRYSCNLSEIHDIKERQNKKCENSQLGPERHMWNNLLWSYGNRKLTKATDKLPAISGLAKLFKSRFGAEYVAGLWSDGLIEGLAWQGLGNKAPNSATQYTGPSWSWASYDGIAATGLRGEWKDVAKIEDWHVELQNEGNPFGEVKNAWIRIHGPMTELKPSEIETTDHDNTIKEIGRTPLPRLRTRYSNNEEGSRLSLDINEVRDNGGWREWNMQVLILCGKWGEEKKADETIEQIVREAEDGQGPRMKRVGWMFLEGEEVNKVIEDKECWREVILV